MWEAERGLPVRRGPGAKGRVYAYPAELRVWRDGVRVETPAAEVKRPPRWPLAAAAVLLLLAATVSWWLWFRPGGPVTYRLDGPLLITFDTRGREAWRHRFASEPMPAWNIGANRPPAFRDIDGGGRNELFLPFKYPLSAARPDVLFCFRPRGEIRWTFSTSRAIVTGEMGVVIYYEFERGLKLARVEVGDSNCTRYKQLHAQGVLKSELTQAEIDPYRNIRLITPWRK